MVREEISQLSEKQRILLEMKLRERKRMEMQIRLNGIKSNPGRNKKYPITYIQKSIWLICKLYAPTSVYNIGGRAKINGDLDVAVFQKAFELLIQKHDILRTVFLEEENQVYATVLEDIPFQLNQFTANNSKDIEKIVNNQRDMVFDLSKEPAFRVNIIQTGEKSWEILLILHHIISDGVSTGIIFKELIESYEVLLGKRKPSEHKLSIQYGDYALWQNEILLENVTDAYWKKTLKDISYQLDFFDECKELKRMEDKSSRQDITLDQVMVKQIKEMAKECNITVFHILLSAFYVTLMKYSGQTDLMVGVLTSGRDQVEISGLIGCFIMPIPIRIQVDENQPVKHFLPCFQQQFLEDFKHKEEYMKLEDDKQEFQILFSYEEDPKNAIKVEGLSMTFEEIATGFCRSEMELELNRCGDEINGWINYRESLFDTDYMKQFIRHYKNVIKEMTQNSEVFLKDIQLLLPAERKQLINDFNPLPTSYERDKSITDILMERAQEYPKRVALYENDKEITYEELNQLSNRIANYLDKAGINNGDKVGLISKRGIGLIASILGILKCGAAYVPIDKDMPQDRKAFILKDSGAHFILMNENEDYEETGERKLQHFLIDECLDYFDNDNRISPATSESLAYLIYTSGTTGIPKGVLITHKNVLRTVRNSNYLEYEDNDRLLQLSSYVFDGSVFDIFGALLNGAGLVLLQKEDILDIKQVARIIKEKQVTVTFITTALFNAIVDIDITCLDGLRKIFFGGERASVIHVRKAYERLGGGHLHNIYGPTEGTVFSTFYPIDDAIYQMDNIPIGKPLSNTTCHVVDASGNLQPLYVRGELMIGGEGIAIGYLNRPEINEEKFILLEGEKYYRTGDIVKWISNGNIQFYGRTDDQVKYRGFRIELGEVERAILQCEGMEKVCVVLNESPSLGTYLCAYMVAKDKYLEKYIKEKLKQALPAYMIPNYFIRLEDLPINRNGKVDKDKLPVPEITLSENYFAPRNELEEILCEIWQEVLGVEKVGINDDFFELGGHSIKLAKMCAQVNRRLGINLSMKYVFAHPTIEAITEYENSTDNTKQFKIESLNTASFYETSKSQKRMYFLHAMNPNSTAYNIPFAVKISGKVDTLHIKESVNELIKRHEMLRSSFIMENQEVVQRVEEPFTYELEVIESELPLQDLVMQFIKPFTALSKPLFRIQLVKCEQNAYYFLGDFHHIIFDGVSMEVFLEELSYLYTRRELNPIRIQYKDYAYWHNQYLASKELQLQGTYWKKQFAVIPKSLDLPLDYQRPNMKSTKGEIIYFSIGEELTKIVRKSASDHKMTVNNVLFTAFVLLLWKYTKQEDITVGSPVAGRNSYDTQRMLGMFLNTLPIRTYPRAEITVHDFLAQVKASFVNALENQSYPFDQLIEDLKVERSKNRNPLFDVMFIMQNSVEWKFDFGDTKFELCDIDYKSSKFDLQLEVYEKENQFDCLVAYSTDLFMRSTIEALIEHYQTILNFMCQNPETKLRDMNIEGNCDNGVLAMFEADFEE